MTGPVDLDLVKATLAARIDDLVTQLYPAAVRDGHHWCLGDVSGAPGQSLRITRSGSFAGLWKDFSAGESGSALDLIAHALFGGRVDAATVRWAVDWCQLGQIAPKERDRAVARAHAAQARAEAEEADRAARKSALAQRLWAGAARLTGRTPADLYLQGRGIDFAALGRQPGGLRFAAEVYNTERDAYLPALLGYVFDPIRQAQVALHRTYIRRGEDSVWRKDARLTDAKKSLGPFRGGHIPVWRGAHGGPLAELPPGTWIATAEGIENAASIAHARPELRCIAHISLDNLGALKLPDNIGGLIIGADNDAPGSPAARGMERQLARLAERGIRYEIVRAPDGHKDMNDWLKALKGLDAPARECAG